MDISVLLLVYRRLDKAKEIYEVLQRVKPKKIFVSSNAAANVNEEYYTEQIRLLFLYPDWDCEVYTLFQANHIKDCSTSVTTGINWFFSKVDCGIILEDDCIPEDSFFEFSKLMLEKYNNDLNVMHISGTNLLQNANTEFDYFFSKMILPCWGWASWKRAWEKYTPLMNNWKNHQTTIFNTVSDKLYWKNILQKNEEQLIGWDLQWMVDLWVNNSVGIIPSQNLIKNIGFDKYATLTTKATSKFANLPIYPTKHFNKANYMNYDNEIEKLIIDFIDEL